MSLRRGVLLLVMSFVAALGVTATAAPAFGAYGFIQEWGSAGTEPGKFTDLRDIAVDTNTNVFTLEAGRIQKFGPTGTPLAQQPTGFGANPTSIAVRGTGDTGVVFVVDRDAGISTFRTKDLAPLGSIALTGVDMSNWAKPRAIAVDYLGNLIVAFANDYAAPPGTVSVIAMFGPTGGFIRQVGEYGTADVTTADRQKYATPVDVTVAESPIGSGNDLQIWAVDSTKGRLFHWDRSSGGNPNHSEPADATRWDPRTVALMPLDPLFATGQAYSVMVGKGLEANHPIWDWKGSGQFNGYFGTTGTGPGLVTDVAGIAIDPYQRMFVADPVQHKVVQYGNDGTPGPGDPKDPDPPPNDNPPPPPPIDSLNTQPIICVGLWSAATCGSLPKPDPIYTCVSYWQDCNGFGGSKPAKPGTIDMSGFPASFSVTAGCSAESPTDPYANRRSSATKRAATTRATTTRATGDEKPDYVSPETECVLREYVEGTVDKTQLDDRRAEIMWNIDARTFKGEVAAAYAQVINGLKIVVAPFESSAEEWAFKIFLFASDYADKLFDEMAKPGEPFRSQIAPISTSIVCGGLEDERQTRDCNAIITAYNEQVRGTLNLLKARKKQLFVDMSYSDYKKSLQKKIDDFDKKHSSKKPRSVTGTSSAVRRDVFTKRFVIASGQVRIKPGKTAKLKLLVPKAMRTHLKALKKAGVKTFTARVVTEGTTVPGITSKRTQRITVSLVKVKRGKTKGGK